MCPWTVNTGDYETNHPAIAEEYTRSKTTAHALKHENVKTERPSCNVNKLCDQKCLPPPPPNGFACLDGRKKKTLYLKWLRDQAWNTESRDDNWFMAHCLSRLWHKQDAIMGDVNATYEKSTILSAWARAGRELWARNGRPSKNVNHCPSICCRFFFSFGLFNVFSRPSFEKFFKLGIANLSRGRAAQKQQNF